MNPERVYEKRASYNNEADKEACKVESVYVASGKNSAPEFSIMASLRKLFGKKEAVENIKRDYSAFNNPTTYEKKVIDRFREEGLEDAEIVKCLHEL